MMQIDIGRLNILTYRLCVYNSYTCIYMYVTLTHIHIEKHMHVVYEVYAYLQYYICVLQVLIQIDIP